MSWGTSKGNLKTNSPVLRLPLHEHALFPTCFVTTLMKVRVSILFSFAAILITRLSTIEKVSIKNTLTSINSM